MAIALYEYVVSVVQKYNPNHGAGGRFASGGAGAGASAPLRTDGAAALHRNLAPKLEAINNKIDALPKEPKIAGDIAQAKVGLASAAKSPTPKGSAQGIMNAHHALDSAANKVVGKQTPLAFQIKDIRQDAKFLGEALMRP
jgi:hypothetical protein